MIVRCGRCGTQFDVPGEGVHQCPACGTSNAVSAGGPPPGGAVMPPGAGPEAPPPEPDVPSPRVECPSCGLRFIVGAIDSAPCPNCGAVVPVGRSGDQPEEPDDS